MVDGRRGERANQTVVQVQEALAIAVRCIENKQWREAEAVCRRILATHPDLPGAHNSLGLALSGAGRYFPAIKQLQRAIQLAPQNAAYHNNLCIAHYRLGQLDAAIDAARRALELAPDQAASHCNLSFALLARGDFIEGWTEYEWRLRSPDVVTPNLRNPWRGENFAGKHVYVRAEQGLGDMIQCSRYLPWLARRAKKVSFGVGRPLVSLLRNSFPEIDVLESGEDPPTPYDHDLCAMSLPHVFKTRLETIPADVPYLRAPSDATARWREKLALTPGLKVGIVWAGDPKNPTDQVRSLDATRLPELLNPLLRVAGVSFVSLQLGLRAADLFYLKQKDAKRIVDFSHELGDFADTAGAVMNLDLVISIDSAVAHLAGALGKPVWLLLASQADWRWLVDRDDTAWYPSMQLFRQRQGEGWSHVIEHVVTALKQAVANSSLLTPFRAEGERRAAAAHAILECETEQIRNDPVPPPMTITDMLHLAEQKRLQSHLGEAEELCHRALLHDKVKGPGPHDAQIVHLLGLIAHQASKPTEAVARINRAITLNPNEAVYYANLGEIYRLCGKKAEAVTACRRAVELAPKFAAGHNNLGIALLDLGQCEEALAHFDCAVALLEDYVQAHINRGRALQHCRRPAEAEHAYRTALALAPNDPHIRARFAVSERPEVAAAG
jgi:Flp pilus assembly protein TadD